jgi:hypothetical protein
VCGREGRKSTHLAGVGHDVGDVLRSVYRIGTVCALLCNVLEIRHDEREALAVDDMPVEHIELRNRCPSDWRRAI